MQRATLMFTALTLVVSASAYPAEYVVRPNGTGDFPTIQDAIDAAVDGDVILLKKGTFRGDGNRDISFLGKAITVKSKPNKPSSVVIDVEGTPEEPHRAFTFESGETLDAVLQGVTLTGGWAPVGFSIPAGGAFFFVASSATVRDCIILDNYADGACGAASIAAGASPRFLDCQFIGNESPGAAGAICGVLSVFPEFVRCTFIDNHSGTDAGAFGGGFGSDDPTVATFVDCHFEGNSSGGRTGGIGVGAAATLLATRCTFVANTAATEGGALLAGPDATVVAEACTFVDNAAAVGADVALRLNANATVRGCTIVGGSSSAGASLDFEDVGTLAIENTIIAFSAQGPAVGSLGTVTMTCSDVFGNEGGDYVGGIAGLEGVNGNFSADPLFCDASGFDFTLFEDSPCLPEATGCGLVGAHSEGCEDEDDQGEDEQRFAGASPGQPAVLFHAVRPNPFASSTHVEYTLEDAQAVTLAVYDVHGRRIASLVTGTQSAGLHRVSWDGVTDAGQAVEPGVYYIRLDVGGTPLTRSVVFAR